MILCWILNDFSFRYVLVDMRLVTFDNFRNHPGHFSIVVHSHITVYGLIQKIAEVTEIQSTKLSVFCDRTRSKDALLPPEQTLEDYGFHGDVKHNPEEVVLFYDYTVEFTDCPILMCDHYFGNNETKLFEETWIDRDILKLFVIASLMNVNHVRNWLWSLMQTT